MDPLWTFWIFNRESRNFFCKDSGLSSLNNSRSDRFIAVILNEWLNKNPMISYLYHIREYGSTSTERLIPDFGFASGWSRTALTRRFTRAADGLLTRICHLNLADIFWMGASTGPNT